MSEKTLSDEIIRLGEIAAGWSWETEFRAIAAAVRALTAERDELVRALGLAGAFIEALDGDVEVSIDAGMKLLRFREALAKLKEKP